MCAFPKKDMHRGEHYHKVNSDLFYVVTWAVEVILELPTENCKKKIRNGDMFVFNPCQKHTLVFIEDTIMIQLYDKAEENNVGEKDICKYFKKNNLGYL